MGKLQLRRIQVKKQLWGHNTKKDARAAWPLTSSTNWEARLLENLTFSALCIAYINSLVNLQRIHLHVMKYAFGLDRDASNTLEECTATLQIHSHLGPYFYHCVILNEYVEVARC